MVLQPPQLPSRSMAPLITGAVVFVALLGAGTALLIAGRSIEDVVGLIGGIGAAAGAVIGVLSKLATVEQKTDAQSAVIAKIDEQTNGVLSGRIRTEVGAALTAALPAAIAEARRQSGQAEGGPW